MDDYSARKRGKLSREKSLTRTLGFSLILGGIIVLSMTYSEGIDNDKGFYKVVATFLLISGVYLCFAHNWKTDEELEWKLIVSFLLLFTFLTFGICFFKAYDDIISERSNIFVPSVTSQGTCVIVMSLCFALSFVILCIIINQLMMYVKPYANSPSEAVVKYYNSSVRKGYAEDEALELVKKFFTDTGELFSETEKNNIRAAGDINDLSVLIKQKEKEKRNWGRGISEHLGKFDTKRKLTAEQEGSLAQIQKVSKSYKGAVTDGEISNVDKLTWDEQLQSAIDVYLDSCEDKSENIECRKEVNELFEKLKLDFRVNDDPENISKKINRLEGPRTGIPGT